MTSKPVEVRVLITKLPMLVERKSKQTDDRPEPMSSSINNPASLQQTKNAVLNWYIALYWNGWKMSKSNFPLFWKDKNNCSWNLNCQNKCLPIFTKIQCLWFFLFIVAQYKISYWHRNYMNKYLFSILFYFQTWPNLWDESNDIGRSKTTAAISWHPQGKGSTGRYVWSKSPEFFSKSGLSGFRTFSLLDAGHLNF